MKNLNEDQIMLVSGGFKCACTVEVKNNPSLKDGYIATIQTGLESDE